MVGSWSIIVRLDLKSFKWYSSMPFPSNRMLPSAGSMILSKQLRRVDLPAPVLPTIPTFSPSLILRLIFLRMMGRSLRYLAEKFWNSMAPLGKTSLVYPSSFVLHFLQYSVQPFSGQILVKLRTLQTETILVSMQAQLKMLLIMSSLRFMAQVSRSPSKAAFQLLLSMEQPIALMLMKKVSMANLIENQLYKASLPILIRLFVSTFWIWLVKNSCSRLYARMVPTPLTAEVKPETIGELVIFSSLTVYLCVFR